MHVMIYEAVVSYMTFGDIEMLEHDLSARWNIHSIKTGRPNTVPVVLIHALGLDLT